uniref:AP180 N-terminal homology (ANTH) domain-containing protein n=1 Tax=Glycine max TaxID=3847 RepID=K7L503_SOYBN
MSYAKIASASGFSDMNLIILKATAPDDLPLHEKYIQHLFKLFALWTEILWTRSKALISLNPCHFKDDSSFSSLNCVALEDQEEEEANMAEMGRVLEMLPQLQSLIDRVMECYPVGVAAPSFIVQGAMKLIIRDSFVCYTKFRREIVAVLDNLLEMPYRNCIAAFNIYKKAAAQTNELYEWCKAKGLCGMYEYPLLDPIPYIQIKALESFLSGMWQLTYWETLLETSISFISFSHAYQRGLCSLFYHREFDMEQHSFDANEGHYHENANDTWRMAVYNPFSEPY